MLLKKSRIIGRRESTPQGTMSRGNERIQEHVLCREANRKLREEMRNRKRLLDDVTDRTQRRRKNWKTEWPGTTIAIKKVHVQYS